MAELTDLFASIDANKDTREINDKNDYDNQTYDFSPDAAEASGLYFIPEGDERQIDKINFNFKKIIDTPTKPDYVSIDGDYAAIDNEFLLCDTTNIIAQKEEISNINVLDDNLYSVSINGDVRDYTSIAIAQVTELNNIVTANNSSYSIDINSSNAVYVSNAAIAQIDTIDTITVENATDYEITINGTSALYTSDADATIEEITAGLVNAINLLAEPVTATDGASQFTVEANVPGTSFTLNIVQGTMTNTTTTQNYNATLTEIITGLQNAINALAEPVTATLNGNNIRITSNVDGLSFNVNVNSGNISVTQITANKNATLTEILDGLVTAINLSSEPVTATKVGDNIEILSDIPGTSFTLTSTGNMIINNLIENKVGEIVITLPDTTGHIMINVLDIKNNFSTANVILTSNKNIMGSSNDYNLSSNNTNYNILLVNDNDYRVF